MAERGGSGSARIDSTKIEQEGATLLQLDDDPIIVEEDREAIKFIVKGFPEDRRAQIEESDLQRFAEDNHMLAQSTIDIINLCRDKKVDTVFFLDKSARPLGFLFHRTMQELSPQGPRPAVRFINIGRESDDWQDPKVQNKLKEVFSNAVKDKRVCIVDDHEDTGVSLLRAKSLFENVFADADGYVYKYGLQSQPDWNIADMKFLNGVQDPAEETEENAFGYISEPIDFASQATFDEEGKRKLSYDQKSFITFRNRLSHIAEAIKSHVTPATHDAVHIKEDYPSINEYSLKMWHALGFRPEDIDTLRSSQ